MAPLYDYKAFAADGKTARGSIEADSAKSARLKLKKSGLLVTAISEKVTRAQKSGSGGSTFITRVGIKDLALMTRQLASLVKANIPIVDALRAIVDQTEKEKLKAVVGAVKDDVNEGSSLAKALSKHPKVFDRIFVNMVEAGESSGTLSLVLLKLADLKEAQMRLRSKVTSAMTYPLLMLVVAIVLVLSIFTFVIPKLAKVFESINKPIPASTKMLIYMSNFIVNYWMVLVGVVILVLFLFRRYIVSEKGRPRWDAFKLNAPIFGGLIRMIAVTRFSGTMATLLSSGVPILTSMNIAKNLVGNLLIAKAVENARSNITEGQSIAEPLRRSGEFPPLVIHMIAIGEKTGELPGMLENVASTYEEQVNTRIDALTSLLEPAMIVGMGIFVGLIVFSIFIPLLEISNIRG